MMPNEFLDQIWKVYEGFGMVLLHSETVADLVMPSWMRTES